VKYQGSRQDVNMCALVEHQGTRLQLKTLFSVTSILHIDIVPVVSIPTPFPPDIPFEEGGLLEGRVHHPSHLASRLKKEQRYTSPPPLRLHGLLLFYLFISFSSLSYDRSKAYSKASCPHSAI
jgi:hypothetical protein